MVGVGWIWGTAGIGVNCNPLAGSWSRCTGASWMKRIASLQPSTMTHGLAPGLSLRCPALPSLSRHHPPGSSVLTAQVLSPAGPTERGSRRICRGGSCSHHLETQGSRLRTQAPAHERLTWMGAALCSLLATPRVFPLPKTRAIKCFSELVPGSLL